MALLLENNAKKSLNKDNLNKIWRLFLKNFNYTTEGVCSTKITFDLMDGRLYNLQFNGGCMGNLRAISKRVEGREAKQVADILRGNDCRGKGTSCADQLAKAIDEALLDSLKF